MPERTGEWPANATRRPRPDAARAARVCGNVLLSKRERSPALRLRLAHTDTRSARGSRVVTPHPVPDVARRFAAPVQPATLARWSRRGEQREGQLSEQPCDRHGRAAVDALARQQIA